MEDSAPKITAIVLTWNSAAFIKTCVQSLLDSSLAVDILIVDNDSSDATRSKVKKLFPTIPTINTGANLGYAGGNNIGIEQAIENDTEYVFILNPDARVEPDCIEQLYQRLVAEPKLGGVSPKIYYGNSNKIWFAGSTIDWRTGVTVQLGGEDAGQFDSERYTERLNGCAMMIPVSTFRRVGLMDDTYFLYYEESDWSVVCARAGYQLGVVPTAVTRHDNSSSTGGHLSPLYQYYMTRNRLYFVKKFKPRALPRVAALMLLSSVENIYVAYRDASLKRAIVLARAILKGYFDFLRHHFGKQNIPN